MCRRTLCTFFTMLSLLTATAWAQSQIRIVRLSYTEGDVQLDRNDGQGFTKAFLNLPVIEGARLSVGNSSHAEVEFEDGTTSRLTPDTVVDFPELRRTSNGTQTLVNVEQGQVYFNVKHHKEDDFRIRVGNETFVTQKNSHFRLSLAPSGVNVAVFNGDVQMFRSSGQQIEVHKHEFLMLDSADADRYFLSKNVTPDPQDDWDNQREAALEAQMNNINSLNRYGTYVQSAGYGSVWRPYGVGIDWDPFSWGNWVYYPGAGYIWVSGYPWGWAPYRYGGWVYVTNVGWGWDPRRVHNFDRHNFGWNPGPVIFNPPHGYVPPAPPPHHGNGGGIIVVGVPPHGNDHDVDLGHRGHPGSRGGFADTDLKPVAPPANPATSATPVNSNAIATPPRPERTRRDDGANTDSINVSEVNSRPVRAPRVDVGAPVVPQASAPVAPPAVVTTPVISTPRGGHVDRTPSNPTPTAPVNTETRGRPYTPPQPAAPAPSTVVNTPRYTPPPAPVNNAPHYSPPPSNPVPAPHYSPPPSQPAPAPAAQPAARPASSGKDPK